MEKVLPNNLNYNTLKPLGYPSQIKIEKFTPISFTNATTSDLIRFNISSNGFWDPYSAYIKMEVDVTGMDSIGCLSIDSSAHSFINQLTIYNSGTELERVEEYDVLGNLLIDMNYSTDNRVSRLNEGIMSQKIVKNQFNSTKHVEDVSIVASTKGLVGFQPFYSNNIPLSSTQGGLYEKEQFDNMNSIVVDDTNFVQRYEYVDSLISYSTVQSTNFNSQTYNQRPFDLSFYRTNNDSAYATTALFKANCTGLLMNLGYQQAYNQSLSAQVDMVLTTNVYTFETYKGQLYQPILKSKIEFTIPLLSGILGILMPKDSYKYIPMKSLQQLILEFRLNPYAMYTSGYTDSIATLTTAMVTQQKRFWKITKFEINVEMQYFESQVENLILQQLNSEKGIILHTNSWQLGPKYQIPAGTNPSGTYQINLGFESLRNLIWCYIPDDYINYSFARKLFRTSGNLTSFQFKIGSDYYPLLPITGHGGTPSSYTASESDANNSEFLVNLYKVFGKFQNTIQDCIIDNNNFAINCRAYDVTNILALSSGTVKTNLDTAIGQAMFHEQRCVGKALYALNFETLNNDYSLISGINTINNRPFELTIKSDSTNPYPRTVTQFVFCQYDMLVQLKLSGCQVLGRG